MTFTDLEQYLSNLPDEILNDASQIIAETATEYYKETFTKKAFDGNPWEPAKKEKKTGSLLVDSGNLLNSIVPSLISREKVVISAGNDKAPYAQAHNEGFRGTVTVNPFTRKGNEVKGYTREANLPQRQFLGKSEELNELIRTRIEEHLNTLTK